MSGVAVSASFNGIVIERLNVLQSTCRARRRRHYKAYALRAAVACSASAV